MGTQETQHLSVRVPKPLVEWADDYARRMRWKRSMVVVAALEGFRDDAERGVPDAPAPKAAAKGEVGRGLERKAQSPAGVRSEEAKDPRLTQEPQRPWFRSADGYYRAKARFDANGEW